MNKEKIIKRIKNSSVYNTPCPDWVYRQLELDNDICADDILGWLAEYGCPMAIDGFIPQELVAIGWCENCDFDAVKCWREFFKQRKCGK